MVRKNKKQKIKNSLVIEFIVLILVILFLTGNINKASNFFQLSTTKKTDKTEEMYVVEGFDTVPPAEENFSKELEIEEQKSLPIPQPKKTSQQTVKTPNTIEIFSSDRIEANNQRLAKSNRFMKLPEGKKLSVVWHHTSMFESDEYTKNLIQKTLSVPLTIGRDGQILKLYDFTLYSGHHLYQGGNKGQAKLYNNSGDLVMDAKTLNEATIGVEIMHGVRWKRGEMHLPDEVPTEKQLRGIANLFVYFWNQLGVGPDQYLTHSELQTWMGEREKEPRNFFYYPDSIRTDFSAHTNLIKICNLAKEQGAWNTSEFAKMSGEHIAYAIIHHNVQIGINYLEAMIKEGKPNVNRKKLDEYYKTLKDYDSYKFSKIQP